MPTANFHQKKKKTKYIGRPFDESFNDGRWTDTEPAGMDDVPSPSTVRRSKVTPQMCLGATMGRS